jgi:hypothetical protein
LFLVLAINCFWILSAGHHAFDSRNAVAFAAFFKIATTEVDYTTASNWAASGGYGPNQVSAILSLGALMAMLLHLREPFISAQRRLQIVALLLLAQAATFSHGYISLSPHSVAAVLLVQSKASG